MRWLAAEVRRLRKQVDCIEASVGLSTTQLDSSAALPSSAQGWPGPVRAHDAGGEPSSGQGWQPQAEHPPEPAKSRAPAPQAHAPAQPARGAARAGSVPGEGVNVKTDEEIKETFPASRKDTEQIHSRYDSPLDPLGLSPFARKFAEINEFPNKSKVKSPEQHSEPIRSTAKRNPNYNSPLDPHGLSPFATKGAWNEGDVRIQRSPYDPFGHSPFAIPAARKQADDEEGAPGPRSARKSEAAPRNRFRMQASQHVQ